MDKEIYQAANRARVVLSQGSKTFVIVDSNKLLYHTAERGLKPLLDLIENAPEKLEGAIVGDRFMGRSAAFLCIYAKVRAVFAMHISDEAIDLLEKHGCQPSWRETVPYIVERDLSSRYKPDLLLKDVEDPVVAYELLRNYLQEPKE